MAIWLEAGEARAQIDPERGGRIAALRVSGLDLLLPERDDPMRWGCYPMAPWAGRLRRGRFRFEGTEFQLPINLPPHAIHGTVFERAWVRETDRRLSIGLGGDWPFAGRAVQEFDLDPGGIALRLEIHASEGAFPASAGWHPWFARRLARGGPAHLDLSSRSMYARDEEGIPSGVLVPPPAGPWDDCFTDVSPPPSIRWPGAVRIQITSSHDHWVVYDEPKHALCVEPQSGPPDALNLAPLIVRPDEPLVMTARIDWEIEG